MVTASPPRTTTSIPLMRWPEFRQMHPDAWIIVEVLAATAGRLDQISIVELCGDADSTVRRYRELRRAAPERELCFLHTAWEAELEERWQFSRELSRTLVSV